MADRDQIALDAASKIMALMYGPTPEGGSVQLKAGVQVLVAQAMAEERAGGGLDEALRAAAASLRTIASHAGRMECLESLDEVRGYANSRATVAEAALRADGEGGNG